MAEADITQSRTQINAINLKFSAFAQLLLWRCWILLSQPFRRLLALQLFFGRSVYTLGKDCQRSLWGIAGWFSAAPRSGRLRNFSRGYFRVRRWHSIIGTPFVPHPHVYTDLT